MLSHVTSCKQIRAQFGLCQVKNHVQIAHESHDLNIDFCGFKQLSAKNSMQLARMSYTHNKSSSHIFKSIEKRLECNVLFLLT